MAAVIYRMVNKKLDHVVIVVSHKGLCRKRYGAMKMKARDEGKFETSKGIWDTCSSLTSRSQKDRL
eukprot:1146141-Pelagomonas_calceolata.AAC.1